MHYLWEYRLWEYGTLRTLEGDAIEVLDPGRHNHDAGPDFFNAKLSMGGQTWVGNVEIHVRASDWHRHGHDSDPAYHNIILHVVGESDTIINRPDGSAIPQTILPYTHDYRERYLAMVENRLEPLACGAELANIPPIYITDWLTSLGFERLYTKVDRVKQTLERLNGDWQATAYVTIARALGFSTNADAFERTALATPLRVLLKHRNDPQQLEAMLFGQAGLLFQKSDDPKTESYLTALREDYNFLRMKYDLESPGEVPWKLARMRPPNFPHRRIAALSAMVQQGFAPGMKFSHIETVADAAALFDMQINGYWINHYNWGHASPYAPRAFSASSISLLTINAAVPLLYAYGLQYGSDRKMECAVDILQSLQPESNSLTRIFTGYGLPCEDAFTSQAMIHLRRTYCEPRKCLFCRIGHRILAAKAKP